MPKLFGRNYTKRQLLDRVGDVSQLIHARRGRTDEGFAQGADLIVESLSVRGPPPTRRACMLMP